VDKCAGGELRFGFIAPGYVVVENITIPADGEEHPVTLASAVIVQGSVRDQPPANSCHASGSASAIRSYPVEPHTSNGQGSTGSGWTLPTALTGTVVMNRPGQRG